MINNQKLRELAEMNSGSPTFITFVTKGRKTSLEYLEERKRSCASAIPKKLRGDFEKAVDEMEADMKTRGRAVSYVRDFTKEKGYLLELPEPDKEVFVVDASPYIRPMAELIEDYSTIGVILLDHEHARIIEFKMGEELYDEKMSVDIIGKHKKGGWSQRRYQRLREGAIDHFIKDVEDEVEEIFGTEMPELIIGSGDSDALRKLESRLPKHLKDRFRIDGNIPLDVPENTLLREALSFHHEVDSTSDDELVDRLRTDILTHHPASYGGKDVFKALRAGRGEVLLVDKNARHPALKCEECGTLYRNKREKCENCHHPLHKVDEEEELIELAEIMGTRVEFVEGNEYLEELGGVGLIHRF